MLEGKRENGKGLGKTDLIVLLGLLFAKQIVRLLCDGSTSSR